MAWLIAINIISPDHLHDINNNNNHPSFRAPLSSPLSLSIFPSPVAPNVTIEKSLVHSSENFDAQLVCHVLAEPQATVRRAGIKEESNSIEQDDMAWDGMGWDWITGGLFYGYG